ncbi:hypothetical protein [Micromonospora sp. DH14]|uniref:hypothetical protein n=1 Tax=Micromonospora sp. DH14 TaxID=3040120 RepID=UPI0024422A34|nr:hypothetical protein [Micromonospora sp. DH14]MDG9674090.1 hypothetical protein [Micromonospora sp. DH14]
MVVDGTPADPTGTGGLVDKGTKGERALQVPIIEEPQPMAAAKLDRITEDDDPLFVGPRGGRMRTDDPLLPSATIPTLSLIGRNRH